LDLELSKSEYGTNVDGLWNEINFIDSIKSFSSLSRYPFKISIKFFWLFEEEKKSIFDFVQKENPSTKE
jgi:hypothetical protein